jgi:hypothetical protein
MGLHFNNIGSQGHIGVHGSQGCIGSQGIQGTQGPVPKFVNNKYICVGTDKPNQDKNFGYMDLILNDIYYCDLIDNKKWNKSLNNYFHVWDISKNFLGFSLIENFISLAEFREIRINKILE